MDFNLDQFVITQLFAVLIVFTRVGTGIMILPGYGESYVFARTRLLIALMISVVMAPIIQPLLPKVPDTPFSLLIMVTGEVIVGATIGTVARFLISAMHIAGSIISFQSGLSLATQFDYSQTSQGTIIGNLLSVGGVMMIFMLDLHLVMLRGLSDSYTLFAPGQFPPVDDIATYFSTLLGHVFLIGFKLSAPVTVIGLLSYLGSGILTRLMPQMQVFNILQPAQIMIALVILLATYDSIMTSFVHSFADLFSAFLEDGP